jgi:P-type Cu+ transporter
MSRVAGSMGWFSKKKTMHDPVCGMEVDPKTAYGSAEHDGVKFYFCSKDCLDKFNADPHRYGHGH